MKKSIEGNVVKFTFEDGVAPIEFDCAKLSAENAAYCVPFAMCHRLGDMAAIPRKDGLIITEAMRREAIAAGVAHYESGTPEWNMKGGSRPAPQNPAILALAAKLGKTYAEAEAYVANLAIAELSA